MHRARLLPIAALCVATAACGASSGQQQAAGGNLRIVAIGDSETAGAGDPTGLGWVGRYARLLRTELGLRVRVTNLALSGKTSAALLAELRGDARTRTAVRNAQIVLIGIGGADLNAGDDRFAAGRCRAERCYAPVLRSFARNFDAIVGAVRALRGSSKTALRAITQPNPLTGAEDVIPPSLKPIATRIGVYRARTANRAICRAMAKCHGRCIDVLRAFNGPAGRDDAYETGLLNHDDCCYPSAKGQQLVARMLLRTGLAPVR